MCSVDANSFLQNYLFVKQLIFVILFPRATFVCPLAIVLIRFYFEGKAFKQTDGVAMEIPLGPTLTDLI